MKKSILLILLFTLPLPATTYYVDPVDGNDDAPTVDGLSEGNAWSTITYAYANAGAGDTIYLMDGAVFDGETIQNENPAVNSWANKITITKNPGDDPIIQGLLLTRENHLYLEINDVKFRPLADGDTALEIASVSALRFINLDYQGIWNTDYSDLNEKDSSGYDALSSGISFRDSIVGALVEDVTIQDCNINSVVTGISIACYVGDTNGGWTIKDNEVHRTAESQIKLSPDNSATGDNGAILVDGNHLHDYYSFYTGVDMSHASGVSIRASNVTVQNNFIHATGSTAGITAYFGGGEDGVGYSDLLIQNNLVYDNANTFGYAVRLYDISDTGSVIFRNNTIIGWELGPTDPRYYGTVVHINPYGYRAGGDPPVDCSGLELYNNVVVGLVSFDDSQDAESGLGSYTENYNYFYSARNPAGNYYTSHDNTVIITVADYNSFFTSGFFVDPNYVAAMHREDLNWDEYTLDASSPAINFGDPNNFPVTDINGVDRDGSPDAGCYEDTGLFVPSGPPEPNPATWASVPAADGNNAISMVATTATSGASPRSYFFQEITGNPGATNSGWLVSDANYTDSGLDGNTTYTYQCQIRGNDACTGVWSNTTDSNGSALTTDTNAPVPNPATFSTPPEIYGSGSLTMTATTGSDDGPTVEYFFVETSGGPGATNSGWQSSATHIDYGLSHNVSYTYTVQLRDAVPNTGTASSGSSAIARIEGVFRDRWKSGYRKVYRSRYRY